MLSNLDIFTCLDDFSQIGAKYPSMEYTKLHQKIEKGIDRKLIESEKKLINLFIEKTWMKKFKNFFDRNYKSKGNKKSTYQAKILSNTSSKQWLSKQNPDFPVTDKKTGRKSITGGFWCILLIYFVVLCRYFFFIS